MSEHKTPGHIRSDAFNESFAAKNDWREAEAAGIAAVCRAVLAESATPSQLEHAKRLADRLDAMEKERDAAVAEVERLMLSRARYYLDGDGRLWYGGREVSSQNFHYRRFHGWTDPTKTELQEVWVWERSDKGDWWQQITEHSARHHIAGHLPKWPRSQPAATPAAAPADAGEDELRKSVESVLHGYSVFGPTDFLSPKILAAIRPLFAAARTSATQSQLEHARRLEERAEAAEQERDEAIKAVECHKSYHDTERAVKRAEAAEAERDVAQSNAAELGSSLLAMTDERDRLAAELREVRAAIGWGDDHYCYVGACNAGILAAFRATKGTDHA